jgi:uncharacterized protein (DUF58 family)
MSEELSREILKLIDRLEYLPSIRSLKHLSGRHISPLKGHSPEFKEYRNYQAGEDYRLIDWKASARQKDLLIQVKDHQGMHEHWLCPDLSGSMHFPNEKKSKFHSQLLLCGALIYLLHAQGDKVGLAVADETQPELVEPMRRTEGLQQMISLLADQEKKNSQTYLETSKLLLKNLRRPSILWFMTDFDHDPSPFLDLMKAASSQGHDIKLIHWMHPDEKFLPYQGEVEFIDLEHKTEDLKLFPEDLQQAYLETYQKHCEQIQQSLKQLKNVHYHLIDITQSIESWLIDTLRTTA